MIASGPRIPEVSKIKVLGLLLKKSGRNDEEINHLTPKVRDAIRLMHRLSTPCPFIRLVRSFAISHITCVTPYFNSLVTDRTKINTRIRWAYKTALGFTETIGKARLLQLGVHNTLEEISEAQRTTQMVRISTTKTGRSIQHP